MSATPATPPVDLESGMVVVFAVGPDFGQSATREMVALCQRHGSEPIVLDATEDPWFAEHLKDPKTREHFPLLCVRGGLVGGLDVVRQLELRRQLGSLLVPDGAPELPRIALSRSAAGELKSALGEPGQSIRIVITSAFEHELAIDAAQPGDIEVMLGDVPILLDAESASRADGLAIDWVDTGDGFAFRMDNPNRPESVRFVDRVWFEQVGSTMPLLIIDVRTAAEHAKDRVSQARLLDVTLIDALEQLDRRTPLLFYCNGGARSRKAAERYRDLGFTEVYCLKEPLR